MTTPHSCLRDDESPKTTPQKRPRDETVTTGADRWLCCRSCATRIAPLAAVLPEGEDPLVFANPEGRVFELLLLGNARALQLVGNATQEFTWFQGYAWRVALCAGCGIHLGWRFETAAERSPPVFFGLLRRELVEEAVSPG
jgi:hypothetical protein